MFVGVFQNGLKARHFDESLTQKLAFTLAKIISKEECYIKGEESNVEKMACNVKENSPTLIALIP